MSGAQLGAGEGVGLRSGIAWGLYTSFSRGAGPEVTEEQGATESEESATDENDILGPMGELSARLTLVLVLLDAAANFCLNFLLGGGSSSDITSLMI